MLRPDQGADQKADTLLHEVLHAIWEQTPLRSRESDEQEEVVVALAAPLLDTLRRNPRLVEYLIGGPHG